MATSDQLLDIANGLATRYPDFHRRASLPERKSLRTTVWAILALRQSIARAQALLPGTERLAAERRAHEDEQLFSQASEMLREKLEMMRPPPTERAAIELEVLGAFRERIARTTAS